jgi:hypothetical protein
LEMGGTLLTFFGGKIICPACSILSNNKRHPLTLTFPFGACQGKFSQIVAASSVRLRFLNYRTIVSINPMSSAVNSRSPIQKGVSHKRTGCPPPNSHSQTIMP